MRDLPDKAILQNLARGPVGPVAALVESTSFGSMPRATRRSATSSCRLSRASRLRAMACPVPLRAITWVTFDRRRQRRIPRRPKSAGACLYLCAHRSRAAPATRNGLPALSYRLAAGQAALPRRPDGKVETHDRVPRTQPPAGRDPDPARRDGRRHRPTSSTDIIVRRIPSPGSFGRHERRVRPKGDCPRTAPGVTLTARQRTDGASTSRRYPSTTPLDDTSRR